MAAFLATHDLHTPRVETVHRLDSVLLPLGFLLFRKIRLLWPGKKVLHHRADREHRGIAKCGDSALSIEKGYSWCSQSSEFPARREKYREPSAITARTSKFCPKFANFALEQGISREFTVLEGKSFQFTCLQKKRRTASTQQGISRDFPKRESRYIDLGCFDP
jgi:hypothetical protein